MLVNNLNIIVLNNIQVSKPYNIHEDFEVFQLPSNSIMYTASTATPSLVIPIIYNSYIISPATVVVFVFSIPLLIKAGQKVANLQHCLLLTNFAVNYTIPQSQC